MIPFSFFPNASFSLLLQQGKPTHKLLYEPFAQLSSHESQPTTSQIPAFTTLPVISDSVFAGGELPHSALRQEAIPLPYKPAFAAAEDSHRKASDILEASNKHSSTERPEIGGASNSQETAEDRIAAWLTIEAYNRM